MVRVKKSAGRNKRKKKILKFAKGNWGSRKNLWKNVKENVNRSLAYAFRDRKTKKRDYRKLWIIRINAGVRQFERAGAQRNREKGG